MSKEIFLRKYVLHLGLNPCQVNWPTFWVWWKICCICFSIWSIRSLSKSWWAYYTLTVNLRFLNFWKTSHLEGTIDSQPCKSLNEEIMLARQRPKKFVQIDCRFPWENSLLDLLDCGRFPLSTLLKYFLYFNQFMQVSWLEFVTLTLCSPVFFLSLVSNFKYFRNYLSLYCHSWFR